MLKCSGLHFSLKTVVTDTNSPINFDSFIPHQETNQEWSILQNCDVRNQLEGVFLAPSILLAHSQFVGPMYLPHFFNIHSLTKQNINVILQSKASPDDTSKMLCKWCPQYHPHHWNICKTSQTSRTCPLKEKLNSNTQGKMFTQVVLQQSHSSKQPTPVSSTSRYVTQVPEIKWRKVLHICTYTATYQTHLYLGITHISDDRMYSGRDKEERAHKPTVLYTQTCLPKILLSVLQTACPYFQIFDRIFFFWRMHHLSVKQCQRAIFL